MDSSSLREQMVEQQLVSRQIHDQRILAAFRKVPRHRFVPKKYLDSAYRDSPLPIGEGQTISQPYMAALMSEHLQVSKKSTVLEIGTGSGYQTAILAELAKRVFSIERIAKLAQKARAVLKDLGCRNTKVKVSDGTMGWPAYAPYQGIIVTAASPTVPQLLIEQLSDGGRLIIPIGTSFSQTLTLITKSKNKAETKEICGCIFVPLVGKFGWPVR